ncbi:MAG TPA: methyltransferase domain-containing protein [Spirochaetota bacterium]|nr:methyltransferase domain-containing protein [Spirochaetota bacterium]
MKLFHLFGKMKDLEIAEIRTKEEFEKAVDLLEPNEIRLMNQVRDACKEKKDSVCIYEGYCVACGKKSSFSISMLYSDGNTPNYREHFVCSRCGLNNRQRMLFDRLLFYVKNGLTKVYMYEMVTHFYQVFSRISGVELVGSEYLGIDIEKGSFVNGIRHEDSCSLSFSDGSFDVIVSQDVYEHVPDMKATLHEAFRVLRVGGVLLATFPFHSGMVKTIKRASIDGNGELIHHEKPEYHGNPVDAESGSLVFWDFGWDIMDMFSEAGFEDVRIMMCHGMKTLNIGKALYFFEAKKSKIG